MGGSLLALADMQLSYPETDGTEAAANMAELMLRMLGLGRDEARALARAPLPAA